MSAADEEGQRQAAAVVVPALAERLGRKAAAEMVAPAAEEVVGIEAAGLDFEEDSP
jgi:hypothetical protein